MLPDILVLLKCPVCDSHPLAHRSFATSQRGEIEIGVVWCPKCLHWYPITEGVLELLSGKLVYPEACVEFWQAHQEDLSSLGLEQYPMDIPSKDVVLQSAQQVHSDWYADNSWQTYQDYAEMPFWVIADALAFREWKPSIQTGALILDIGCAQGRSAFKLMDLPVRIVGFDVSRELVHQARRRYLQGNFKAEAVFFVADAAVLPFVDSCFDHILVYGVLHHLPDPIVTCREIARLLCPGGSYWGCENNKTLFRGAFDLMQRFWPLWHEEAGSQPLISSADFRSWFSETGLEVQYRSSVFLPPHLINKLGLEQGKRWLEAAERIGTRLPGIKQNGGLILVQARKHQE